MTALALVEVSKKFGPVQALDGVELSVSKGEFLCLVGPTNAGKSTLLKTIAGLYRPEKGQVMINGRDVTNFEPGERHVSLLFQTVALFPNKSGYDNIAFPLRRAGLREEQVDRRVREVAELLRDLCIRRPRFVELGCCGLPLTSPSAVLSSGVHGPCGISPRPMRSDATADLS